MKVYSFFWGSVILVALMAGCSSGEEDIAPLPTDKVNKQFESTSPTGADGVSQVPAQKDQGVSDQ